MPDLLTSVAAFRTTTESPNLSVVHFAADWVEQCSQVNDLFDALAKQPEYSKVKFFKCPAEDLAEVSLKYQIEAVPTVILFKSGKEVDRVNGVDANKITAKVKEHYQSSPNTISSDNAEKTVPLDERLKKLINKHNVMLFMKGDRSTPRCGFSKQIIAILNDTGAEYDTFDILSDEEVRQGLKTYSDWPTYPQLYVKGELLGGLDIIKEMMAGGELTQTLNG